MPIVSNIFLPRPVPVSPAYRLQPVLRANLQITQIIPGICSFAGTFLWIISFLRNFAFSFDTV